MKKFIAMTAAIILSGAVIDAHAEEQNVCRQMSELAEVIMENRQANVPMVRAMETADGNELVEEIVIDAYERPAYSTNEYQNRAVREFSNSWYLGCVQARR